MYVDLSHWSNRTQIGEYLQFLECGFPNYVQKLQYKHACFMYVNSLMYKVTLLAL